VRQIDKPRGRGISNKGQNATNALVRCTPEFAMRAMILDSVWRAAIFSASAFPDGSLVLDSSGQNVRTMLRRVLSACWSFRSLHEKRRRTLPVLGLSKYSGSETARTELLWTSGPKAAGPSNSCFHANFPERASYARAVFAFVETITKPCIRTGVELTSSLRARFVPRFQIVLPLLASRQ